MENFYKASVLAALEIASAMDRAAVANPNMASHYRLLAKRARENVALYRTHLATLAAEHSEKEAA